MAKSLTYDGQVIDPTTYIYICCKVKKWSMIGLFKVKKWSKFKVKKWSKFFSLFFPPFL